METSAADVLEIGLLLGLAAAAGWLTRRAGLPAILGYLAGGALLGWSVLQDGVGVAAPTGLLASVQGTAQPPWVDQRIRTGGASHREVLAEATGGSDSFQVRRLPSSQTPTLPPDDASPAGGETGADKGWQRGSHGSPAGAPRGEGVEVLVWWAERPGPLVTPDPRLVAIRPWRAAGAPRIVAYRGPRRRQRRRGLPRRRQACESWSWRMTARPPSPCAAG